MHKIPTPGIQKHSWKCHNGAHCIRCFPCGCDQAPWPGNLQKKVCFGYGYRELEFTMAVTASMTLSGSRSRRPTAHAFNSKHEAERELQAGEAFIINQSSPPGMDSFLQQGVITSPPQKCHWLGTKHSNPWDHLVIFHSDHILIIIYNKDTSKKQEMCCSMMQKSENLLSHFITVHFF